MRLKAASWVKQIIWVRPGGDNVFLRGAFSPPPLRHGELIETPKNPRELIFGPDGLFCLTINATINNK